MANQAEVDLVVNTAGALPDLERQLGSIVRRAENDAPQVDLRAGLRVQETIRSLDADLTRIIARAEVDPQNQIDIDAVLDQRRSLRSLQRQVSGAIRATEAGADPVNVQASLAVGSSLRRMQGQLLAATHRIEAATPPIEVETEVDDDRITRALTNITRGLTRMRPAAATAGKTLAGTVATMGALGGSLNTVAGLVVATTTALEQVAPASALAVSGLTAAALAAVTTKLAFVGVSDAVEAAFDPSTKPKDLEKALARLAPEARKFVGVLQEMRGSLRKVQQDVQNRFFADFDDSLRMLGRTTLPVVRSALNSTATTLNTMARETAKAASTLATNGTLGRALTGATKGLENLSDVPAKVVTGLGQIGAAAAPAFDKVTRRLDTKVAEISEKLARAFASGALEDDINRAVVVIGQFFDTLGNFARGANNIFAGLTAGGGGLFAILNKISEAFLQLSESTEFQSILKELSLTSQTLVDAILPLILEAFRQLGPVIEELAPVVRDFVTAIGPELLPVIEELGPVLVQIAELLREQLPFAIQLTLAVIELLVLALKGIQFVMENIVLPASRAVSDFFENDFVQSFNEAMSVIQSGIGRSLTDFGSFKAGVSAIMGDAVLNVITAAGRIKDGLIGQLTTAVNIVLDLFRDLPGKIASNLAGLANVLFDIGRFIVQGLINGILSQFSGVISAARTIADAVSSTISSVMDINSPSKVTAAQGRFIAQGLIVGLTGSIPQIRAATEKVAKTITDALSGRAETNTLRRLNVGSSALERLAAQETAVAGRLKTANKALSDQVKARNDLVASVRKGVLEAADITNIRGLAGADDILTSLTDQLAKARTFAEQLSQLRAQGVRADLIAQIAQAGVGQGSAAAAALANATSAQIAQINETQRQLVVAANKAGSVAGSAMFDAGIKAAQGLVKGLQQQQSAIERQMLLIARAMQSAIKQALGIRSPSRVMAALGAFAGQGLAQGLESMLPRVTQAVDGLTSVISRPLVGTSQPLALAGAQVPSVNVFIGSERLNDRIDYQVNKGFRDRDRVLTQGVRRLG